MKNIIPEDYIVYGEVYGKGIQDLNYGLDAIDLVVFDVKFMNDYLDWMDLTKFCQYFGFKMVPALYVGQFSEEILKDCTIGKSILCPTQIREGCVVKSHQERNHPRIGRKILKSINPEYLLRKDGTEYQ